MGDGYDGMKGDKVSAKLSGDTLSVELFYPPREDDGTPRYIEVGMCDVRAVDRFRAHFDFPGNCWVLSMRPSWPDCEPRENLDELPWVEVARIPAWLEPPVERSLPYIPPETWSRREQETE